jgi:predicted dehydrogenase
VIGLGVTGAEHTRRLTRVIGGASVCGVTDFAGDRAEALAAEFAACVFGSAEELIDADDTLTRLSSLPATPITPLR